MSVCSAQLASIGDYIFPIITDGNSVVFALRRAMTNLKLTLYDTSILIPVSNCITNGIDGGIVIPIKVNVTIGNLKLYVDNMTIFDNVYIAGKVADGGSTHDVVLMPSFIQNAMYASFNNNFINGLYPEFLRKGTNVSTTRARMIPSETPYFEVYAYGSIFGSNTYITSKYTPGMTTTYMKFDVDSLSIKPILDVPLLASALLTNVSVFYTDRVLFLDKQYEPGVHMSGVLTHDGSNGVLNLMSKFLSDEISFSLMYDHITNKYILSGQLTNEWPLISIGSNGFIQWLMKQSYVVVDGVSGEVEATCKGLLRLPILGFIGSEPEIYTIITIRDSPTLAMISMDTKCSLDLFPLTPGIMVLKSISASSVMDLSSLKIFITKEEYKGIAKYAIKRIFGFDVPEEGANVSLTTIISFFGFDVPAEVRLSVDNVAITISIGKYYSTLKRYSSDVNTPTISVSTLMRPIFNMGNDRLNPTVMKTIFDSIDMVAESESVGEMNRRLRTLYGSQQKGIDVVKDELVTIYDEFNASIRNGVDAGTALSVTSGKLRAIRNDPSFRINDMLDFLDKVCSRVELTYLVASFMARVSIATKDKEDTSSRVENIISVDSVFAINEPDEQWKDISATFSTKLAYYLCKLVYIGTFGLNSARLYGRVNFTKPQSSALMVGLKFDPVAVTILGFGFGLSRVALAITGEPSIDFMLGIGMLPPGGDIDTDLIEFIGKLSFTDTKVGVALTMKNMWKEPFGLKQVSIGNLAVVVGNSYANLSTLPETIAAAVATGGLGIGGILKSLLPDTLGMAGEVWLGDPNDKDKHIRAVVQLMVGSGFAIHGILNNGIYNTLPKLIRKLTQIFPIYGIVPTDLEQLLDVLNNFALDMCEIQIVPKYTKIGEIEVEQGFVLHVEGTVFGKKYSVYGEMMLGYGIRLKGTLEPLHLPDVDPILSITGTGGGSSIIELNISATSKVTIDSHVVVKGFFDVAIKCTIDRYGINVMYRNDAPGITASQIKAYEALVNRLKVDDSTYKPVTIRPSPDASFVFTLVIPFNPFATYGISLELIEIDKFIPNTLNAMTISTMYALDEGIKSLAKGIATSEPTALVNLRNEYRNEYDASILIGKNYCSDSLTQYRNSCYSSYYTVRDELVKPIMDMFTTLVTLNNDLTVANKDKATTTSQLNDANSRKDAQGTAVANTQSHYTSTCDDVNTSQAKLDQLDAVHRDQLTNKDTMQRNLDTESSKLTTNSNDITSTQNVRQQTIDDVYAAKDAADKAASDNANRAAIEEQAIADARERSINNACGTYGDCDACPAWQWYCVLAWNWGNHECTCTTNCNIRNAAISTCRGIVKVGYAISDLAQFIGQETMNLINTIKARVVSLVYSAKQILGTVINAIANLVVNTAVSIEDLYNMITSGNVVGAVSVVTKGFNNTLTILHSAGDNIRTNMARISYDLIAISTAVDNTVATIAESKQAHNVYLAIRDSAKETLDHVGKVFNAIGEEIKTLANKLVEIASKILTAIKTIAVGLFTLITNIPDLIAACVNFFNSYVGYALMSIFAESSTVFAIGKDGYVYRWSSTRWGKESGKVGTFSSVACGRDGYVYALTSNGNMYMYNPLYGDNTPTSFPWERKVGPSLSMLSVLTSIDMYGIRTNGMVVYWNGSTWDPITVGGGYTYATCIAYTYSGTLYYVGTDSILYTYSGTNHTTTYICDKVKYVSADDDNVWYIDTSDTLWHRVDNTWKCMNTKAKRVAASLNGDTMIIGMDDIISRYSPDGWVPYVGKYTEVSMRSNAPDYKGLWESGPSVRTQTLKDIIKARLTSIGSELLRPALTPLLDIVFDTIGGLLSLTGISVDTTIWNKYFSSGDVILNILNGALSEVTARISADIIDIGLNNDIGTDIMKAIVSGIHVPDDDARVALLGKVDYVRDSYSKRVYGTMVDIGPIVYCTFNNVRATKKDETFIGIMAKFHFYSALYEMVTSAQTLTAMTIYNTINIFGGIHDTIFKDITSEEGIQIGGLHVPNVLTIAKKILNNIHLPSYIKVGVEVDLSARFTVTFVPSTDISITLFGKTINITLQSFKTDSLILDLITYLAGIIVRVFFGEQCIIVPSGPINTPGILPARDTRMADIGLISPNGMYKLQVYNGDLYHMNKVSDIYVPIRRLGVTGASYTIMSITGILSVRDSNDKDIFSIGTRGTSYLSVKDDGRVILCDSVGNTTYALPGYGLAYPYIIPLFPIDLPSCTLDIYSGTNKIYYTVNTVKPATYTDKVSTLPFIPNSVCKYGSDIVCLSGDTLAHITPTNTYIIGKYTGISSITIADTYEGVSKYINGVYVDTYDGDLVIATDVVHSISTYSFTSNTQYAIRCNVYVPYTDTYSFNCASGTSNDIEVDGVYGIKVPLVSGYHALMIRFTGDEGNVYWVSSVGSSVVPDTNMYIDNVRTIPTIYCMCNGMLMSRPLDGVDISLTPICALPHNCQCITHADGSIYACANGDLYVRPVSDVAESVGVDNGTVYTYIDNNSSPHTYDEIVGIATRIGGTLCTSDTILTIGDTLLDKYSGEIYIATSETNTWIQWSTKSIVHTPSWGTTSDSRIGGTYTYMVHIPRIGINIGWTKIGTSPFLVQSCTSSGGVLYALMDGKVSFCNTKSTDVKFMDIMDVPGAKAIA